MKICDCFDIHNAILILEKKHKEKENIYSILENDALVLGTDDNTFIRSHISLGFNQLGWADKVKVDSNSNISISFMKNRIGVCIQFGNVARTYADLLKLSLMGKNGHIDIGIIAVADSLESKLMGANYANFQRLAREIELFSKIIEVPILVLSISN